LLQLAIGVTVRSKSLAIRTTRSIVDRRKPFSVNHSMLLTPHLVLSERNRHAHARVGTLLRPLGTQCSTAATRRSAPSMLLLEGSPRDDAGTPNLDRNIYTQAGRNTN
jgi:hypothetical protein